MCGISVVIDAAPVGRPQDALARMHQLLAHRGPDGEGHLWIDPSGAARAVHGTPPPAWDGAGVFAAFRWLKVQDPEADAIQPMRSADGRDWLLFNGEIYNHGELRRELAVRGHAFRTRSDTEVLLAALREWGTGALPRLRGMWAFAWVDLARRRVVVSRDRLGIKPLFFARDGQRLLLASEARAVALAHRDGARPEPFRLHEFLRGLPPQSADLSFFRGVLPVPAGSWAEVPLAGALPADVEFHRFWDLADHRMEAMPEQRFEACREEFEHLLHSSVEEHAGAAVEVGTLLSGGLDSSTLARLLANRAQGRGLPAPNAYSIIYDDPQMSEWPYMQFVIGQGGLRGVKHVLTPEQVWSASSDVVWAQGQPLLGQDVIAQYHAYGLARQHGSVVVWDGQGADEMLAGMRLYETQWMLDLLRRGRVPDFLRETGLRARRDGIPLAKAFSSYLLGPLKQRWQSARGLPRYDWLSGEQADSTAFGPGRTRDWGPEESLLTRFLYRLVRHTNLPQVLLVQDHGSMAHGIESRVPYLDHRIVEFVFRLPDSFKLHRGQRKRILLETARRVLPPQITERRDKRALVSRMGWIPMRERHADALREAAASRELRESGFVHARRLQAFVEDYLAGRHEDELAAWRVHSLWQWLRLFGARS